MTGRLTQRNGDGGISVADLPAALEKLAAYENTGLSPTEIVSLKALSDFREAKGEHLQAIEKGVTKAAMLLFGVSDRGGYDVLNYDAYKFRNQIASAIERGTRAALKTTEATQ